MDKSANQLRNYYRQLRADLDEAAQVKAGQLLCDRIMALSEYQQAKHIAVYSAVMGEISLEPVIDHALSRGKNIYFPNLDQKSLRFSPYFREQKMRINRYKLPEPDVGDDEMLAPEALNLVLAPLVVFDAMRNRIGMGGGFYDRSFAFRKDPASKTPVLIGVAHELQKYDRLEPESWDVRLDMIVTDQAIYR
jgi:5-formyltetrahydrofolate cyclo-ligase